MLRRRLAWSFGILLALLVPRAANAEDAPTFADRSDDAAEDADASGAFLVNPLAMACGIFGGEADFVVARSLAAGFEAAAYQEGRGVSGLLSVGLLVYPQRSALHGLYLEVRLGYAQRLEQRVTVGAGGVASASVVAGWQWTWDYGFSLRLGAGLVGATGSLSSHAPTIGLGRLALVADAGLGWAW